MIGILLIVAVIALIYRIANKPYSYWAKKNVQTGKVIPLFGDNLPMILGNGTVAGMVQTMYNKLPDVRYVGAYQLQMPVLVLKSPDIIKQICVKDSDHFLNHRSLIPDGIDELWSKNLFSLKGQTWKNMRSTLSPSFTSSKMKSMFILICQNANLFVEYFMKNNEEIIEVEFKDAYSRYTSDVIASAAFGIQVDSLKDKENEFFLMGNEAGNFAKTAWSKIVFFLYQICPQIASFFRVQVIDMKVRKFFLNLVKDTIKMREEQNIKRPDMLGLLMEARKGQQPEQLSSDIKETSFAAVEEHLEMTSVKEGLTDGDIASQVFIFFLGGFESISTSMCFMAYELALNPDVQKKLTEEIDECETQNGAPSYETITNMTYMDMVVSESLRKWPTGVMTDRVVTKPYTIQPELPEEKPVHLDINDNIMIPIFAIHRDPKIYENPEKFDPERFSPENRTSINPYSYLPFGVGPRNCIGSRFALLELKAVFFYLLSYFEIVPIKTTPIPMKISKSSFNLSSENGFPLGLKKRVSKNIS